MSILQEFSQYWNSSRRDTGLVVPLEGEQFLKDTLYQSFVRQYGTLSAQPEVQDFSIRASSAGKPLVLLAIAKLQSLGLFPNGEEVTKTFSQRTIFFLGDSIEAAVLSCMLLKGLPVSGYQMETHINISGWSVPGHIDCIVNRTLIDVKSMSFTYFKNFVSKPNNERSYLTQAAIYFYSLREYVDNFAFVCINKSTGLMAVVHIPIDTLYGAFLDVEANLEKLSRINSYEDLLLLAKPPEPISTKKDFLIPPSMEYSDSRYWIYCSDDGVSVNFDSYRKLWYNK